MVEIEVFSGKIFLEKNSKKMAGKREKGKFGDFC